MIVGNITSRNSITGGSATRGSGVSDHTRLTNRDAADQHPIEAITGLEEVLDSKLDSETALPLIDKALKSKGAGLFYDVECKHAKNPYWYVTAEVDPETGLGTEASIISGPYNLGAGGGGGGGGTTEVTILNTNPETGEALWPSAVSLEAKTEIGIYWTSMRDDKPTGAGTMYLYINDVLVSKKAVKQGEVRYDITEYISSGENKIEFKVTDAYSTSKNLIGNLTGVSLKLTSTFEDDVSYSGDITYIYTPIGDVSKTVHFIVDGEDTGTDVVRSTGEQQTHMLKALSHGAHTLSVYFTAILDGEEVRSNTLNYDLICYEAGNRTPIIASTFPAESTKEQYVSLAIRFRVYTPGKNNSTVYEYIDGKQQGSALTVDMAWKTWEDRPTVVGDHIYMIKTGSVSRTFKVHVTESTIRVEPVTQNLKLYLNCLGKSNDQIETREEWIDKAQNIKCNMSGFNWSSNGWVLDKNGETILRLSGDARVEIPYQPFASDLQQTGKTLEFEIATTDVKKYETRIVECLTGGDSLNYSYKLAGEDDRPKYFVVGSVDNEKFIEKVKGIHRTYLFQHNGKDWILDGAPVDLGKDNEYGIEIFERSRGEGGDYYINGDRITVAYEVLGRGIYITPSLAKFQSQLSALSTQYKEDEKVRLSFVVEKRTENSLIYMYINGIMSGVTKYPSSDSFAQSPAANILLGSNDATLDIYNIRIYDNSLTRKQIVNNWIADMSDPVEKAVYFQDNDNFDETGKIVIAKLPSKTPYMIVTAPELPSYKKDKKTVDVEFVYPGQDNRYFRAEGATADVQGTSSQYYYRKNFKVNYKTGFYDIDGEWDEKYKINPPLSKKEKKFTYKADVASSEGANNVELVKYFEDTKNWNMPAELDQDAEDTQDGYKTKDRIRTGIDGFPIVMFHNNGASTSFYGKMNFNNDKDNKNTFGFTDGDECWEFINNTTPLVLFQTDDISSWNISFESRYPETYGSDEHAYGTAPGELDKLKKVVSWIYSTMRQPIPEDASEAEKAAIEKANADKLSKFKREFSQYFDLESSLFYYLYTELFLMVDSRAKNAMLAYLRSHTRGDGGDRWFWLPYDMDTAIGTNNEGLLVFDYDAEDTDIINGAYVYNGQQSVFWNNLRDAFKTELADRYNKLRSGNAGGEKKWSYAEIEKMFEDHQKVWSASIFNEDSFTKYLEPLINNNDATYLGMAQGSKSEQRKWWLWNRFKYLDSKYRCGDAKDQNIMLRTYTRSNLEITPYINCYVTGVFDQAVDDLMVTVDAERDTKCTIVPPEKWDPKDTDPVVIIYSADLLRDVGDLSGLKPGYADFSAATKLQRLQIGNAADGYSNDKLTILNVGNNHLLTYIDARNCSALGTGDTKVINLSNCTSIEEVYFDNTNISGVSLPVGGNLQVLHLPDTITDLTIRNHPNLKDCFLAGTKKLTSLWLEDVPSEAIVPSAKNIIMNMPDGSSIRWINLVETINAYIDENGNEVTAAEQIKELYDQLDLMKGKDGKGDTVSTAQLTGVINVDEIAYSDWHALSQRYPEVEIRSPKIICSIEFYGEDTSLPWRTQSVKKGNDADDPGIPTKTPTDQYYYEFIGWDKDFTNVQTDMEIYASFEPHIQHHKVTFHTESRAIATPDVEEIEYGSYAYAPEISNQPEGTLFLGWFRADGNIIDFETEQIKRPIDLYAHWQDENLPTVTLRRETYNKFSYVCTDNVGVVAYAITKSPIAPTDPEEWTYIESVERFEGEYEIDSTGYYYMYVMDAQGKEGDKSHITSAKILSESLTMTKAEGEIGAGITKIVFIEKSSGTEMTDFALSYTEATCHVEWDDTHYDGTTLNIKLNDLAISNDSNCVIDKSMNLFAEVTPRNFVCEFDRMGKGQYVPPETVVYLHNIPEPAPQFDDGSVIEGWYLDREFKSKWNFDSMVITGDMKLYANWIEYKDPTLLSIVTTEDNQTIELALTQTKPEGVAIRWGDEGPTDKPTTSDSTDQKIILSHTYNAPAGTAFTISLTAQNKAQYRLGRDHSQAVLTPIEILKQVTFAWDVSEFEQYAFRGAVGLTNIVLTRYMTTVSLGAFMNCSNLVKITMPNTIKTIGASAFQGCNSLQGTLILPNRLNAIGYQAFQYCLNLEEIILPDTVTEIGQQAFASCGNLRSISLPRNPKYTTVGDWLFISDRSLESMIIPSNVTKIGVSVFDHCSSLSKLVFEGEDLEFSGEIISNCSSLETAGPIGEGNYNIEYAWKTRIPRYAFSASYGKSSLSNVVFPSTLEDIDDRAFYGCNALSLQNKELPASLRRIGEEAFAWCRTLKRISIPVGVDTIEMNAFDSDIALVEVNIYTMSSTFKVKSATELWFKGCSAANLELHLPSMLSAIDAQLAYGPMYGYVAETTPLNMIVFDL